MKICLMFLFFWAVVSAGPPVRAAQQYQYTNKCYDCHGTALTDPGNPPNDFRPLDAQFRNVTTGAFKGSHRTHMALTTDQNACVKCHGAAVAAYTTGHMSGSIDMTANVNNSPKAGGGTYSRGILFNWTSNQAALGTCSNVNCHFEASTPTWSGTPFNNAAVTDCNQCHGAPPSGANGTAGSHAKHDSYFGGANECKKCHDDHVAEGNRFAHATSAGKRNIIVIPHDPADVAAGSYSGTGDNYLPSQSGAQSFGSCSNLYCHSQGKSAASFNGNNAAKNVPTWGGSLPADCAGCHGGNMSAGGFNAMSTGKHQAHINNEAKVGRKLGCQECHNATTASGTSIASTTNHVNKNVNIKFNDSGINKDSFGPTYDGGSTTGATGQAKAPGSAPGAGCSNIYCHSDGNPNTAGADPQKRVYRTVAWSGSLSCDGCHGNQAGISYPTHGNSTGGAGQPGSNSHTVHAGAGYAFNCVKCHSTTTSDGVNVIAGGTHVDGSRDVAFDALNPSGSYTGAGQSCSTLYCHSNGGSGAPNQGPVWGASMPADCTGCHGNNATSATPMASNKHGKHVNNPNFLGINNNFSCVECHAATLSADRTLADKTRHVNGFKDFSGARAYKTGFSGGSCTTYCHSSGQATPVYRNMTGSKAWGGSATLGCKSCHGYGQSFGGFSSSIGEPNYASGAAGSATANTHQTHVAQRNIVDSRGCADCHRTSVDRGVAGKLKDYSSAHLNGSRDLRFVAYNGYSGSYNSATKTCSNTYCHASSSPQWGNNVAITCDFCHKGDNTMPAAHSLHWEPAVVAPSGSYTATPANISADASKYQFVCTSCHSSPAQHAAGPATTYRAAQVFFGYTAPGRTGSYTDGGSSVGSDGSLQYTNGSNCTTTYCHSNGNGSDGRVAVTWNSTLHTANKNVRCSTCHNYTAVSTFPMASGKHTKHVNDYAFACVECHAATVDASANIIDTRNHVNKQKDVSWGTENAGGDSYAGSSTTCSNIYCHSQGSKWSAPYTTPKVTTLTWSAGSTTCGSCHGGAATGPDYASGSPKKNSHASHVVTMGFACVECHSSVVDATPAIVDKSLHANKAYNVANGSGKFTLANTPDPSTPAQCSNITCHGNNGATWGTTVPGCEDCHLAAGAAGSGVKNFNPSDGTISKIATGDWTGAGHGRASAYASGNPAAGLPNNGCYYCHSLSVAHKTTNNMFRFIQANYSTVAYGRNAICLVCHAATGSTGVNPGSGLGLVTATKKVSATHYGSKHGGANGTGGQFCWDCHDPHGDNNNAYMINTKVAKASDRATGLPTTQVTVAFSLSTPVAGTDYAGTATSICNACHTATAHYAGAGSNDGHNADTRCTTCHSHSNSFALYAFRPSNNCDSCHGYPPVRRNLTKYTDFGKQGAYSSARFEDYSGGGGAHTIAKHVSPNAKASEGWANCAVCHTDGSMSPGTHTMATPVRPSNLTIDVQDSRKLDYRRSLGSERYSGTLTDKDGGNHNTNVSGSCSNVACHFKPSKKWSLER